MNEKKKVVILGAGVAGLAAGYCLARTNKFSVTVLEKAPVSGGLCASFDYNGFTLDYGPHKIYSVIPGVLDEIREIMGDRLLKLEKKNRIYLKGHLLDYPLKLGNLIKAFGFLTFLKLGFGYALTVFKGIFYRQPPRSYEEYMTKCFGTPAYQMVFQPLAEKTWGDPTQLHSEMARTRVPASGGLEIMLKLLGLKKETAATNAEYFYYPKAGFGDWPQKLREEIESAGSHVFTKADVVKVEKSQNHITKVIAKVDGQEKSFDCDHLISTIPLNGLGQLLIDDPSKRVSDGLVLRHLVLVYVFINKPLVLKDQWIFFPEKKFFFGRIFEQKQMNPELAPADKTMICCDLTCAEESDTWKADDKTLAAKCIESLKLGGFITDADVEGYLVKKHRNFYPCYGLDYAEKLESTYNQFKCFDNLLLTGRLGMFNYNNSDHCYDMGRFLSDKLSDGLSAPEAWKQLEERVKSYKIVD